MKRDVQESLKAWSAVSLSGALFVFALTLLKNVNIPTWQPLLTGVLGVAGLIIFGRQLWARRQKGPKGR